MVQKQSGMNTMKVAKAVQAEMESIRKTMPADVSITQVQDASELVEHAIKNLTTTILWASLLVILVVLFFLRELRSSFIIIFTIPFSLIVAFIFMFIAKFSVNIFSLMALAIAIGMVVDNSIVVFENITRHIENGEKPKAAAEFGASEMGMAISASTLTTIAVFLPMVFIGGLVGILFKQLALLTSITLIASLFTALTPHTHAGIPHDKKGQNPQAYQTLCAQRKALCKSRGYLYSFAHLGSSSPSNHYRHCPGDIHWYPLYGAIYRNRLFAGI